MNNKEFLEIAKSIHIGGVKRYSEHSRIPLEQQKRARIKHRKDLIQPRVENKLNPEFIQRYGTKGLYIDDQDVRDVESQMKRMDVDKRKVRGEIKKYFNVRNKCT